MSEAAPAAAPEAQRMGKEALTSSETHRILSEVNHNRNPTGSTSGVEICLGFKIVCTHSKTENEWHRYDDDGNAYGTVCRMCGRNRSRSRRRVAKAKRARMRAAVTQ
eukprot:gnl/TRDRNA2_/TRDRNA2_204814_c0_seq1.p1 gnl/TRDRNA2_/TRDRNA2_204814_c0~~gnl/TRDRNA2_/TRDRNA2_204814_c0_seq1.p1  ORF type:complete len:107 (-),score=7.56 gnl/TRDRNA2_/TRDRNA2_204814_c0_seq1:162-482(-)